MKLLLYIFKKDSYSCSPLSRVQTYFEYNLCEMILFEVIGLHINLKHNFMEGKVC